MSGFLIDTNVLSEYNRAGVPDAGVKRWLEATDRQSQHVSVITLAEIRKGIELLAGGRRRAQLEQWLARDLEVWFAGRVLPQCEGHQSLGNCVASRLTAREVSVDRTRITGGGLMPPSYAPRIPEQP